MIVHVINLPHRTDRLEYVKKVCEREGLELSIHEATNGQQKYAAQFTNRRMRGHAGCHNSHVTLLQKIKGRAEYHIILEDDVELTPNFKSKVQQYIKEDFDILYLGGNINVYDNPTEPYDDQFDIARKVMATHAYIVRDSSIDSILEIITKRVHKIDVMFMDVQQQMNALITKECLGWQRETFSDIGFKTLNINTKY
jgi:GR25 family glycosyltransferase involved in LPS biosynthesis